MPDTLAAELAVRLQARVRDLEADRACRFLVPASVRWLDLLQAVACAAQAVPAGALAEADAVMLESAGRTIRLRLKEQQQ